MVKNSFIEIKPIKLCIFQIGFLNNFFLFVKLFLWQADDINFNYTLSRN